MPDAVNHLAGPQSTFCLLEAREVSCTVAQRGGRQGVMGQVLVTPVAATSREWKNSVFDGVWRLVAQAIVEA